MALRLPRMGQPLEVRYHKDSGSAPTPTDPYEQAAAQYGLSTGTAAYNAGLNRYNTVNPVGSTTWSNTGESAGASPAYGLGGSGVPMPPNNQPNSGGSTATPNPLSYAGLTGESSSGTPQMTGYALGDRPVNYAGDPFASQLESQVGQPAPQYTESTQFAPQFQSILSQPINTAGIPELSGENLTPLTNETQNAVFEQNMGYLAPEEQLQSEGLNSQLAAEGVTPGSDAYANAESQLGRQQTFENTQAASGAVTAGEQELNNLFGLGGQTLQSEIAYQNQPINEFNALQGGAGASATAQTPDISGAFGQQYQGQLAGYNANVASNNQTTSEIGSLIALAAMFA